MKKENCPKCGIDIFLDDNQPLHKDCPRCGKEINPDYSEQLKLAGGPTITEWVDAGYKAVDYPPKGFTAKALTEADLKRIDEMNDAENRVLEATQHYDELKLSNEKLQEELKKLKQADSAKVHKEEKVKA